MAVMTGKPMLPLLVSAAAATLIGLWLFKRKRKSFEKVGTVKQLVVHPVRSMNGIEVNEVQCTSRGLEYNGIRDRAYMLATCSENRYLMLKDEPSLVLFKISVSGKELTISSESGDSLKLTVDYSLKPNDKTVTCKMEVLYPELNRRSHSKDKFEYFKAADCGDEAAKWFQKYLKRSDVRLIRAIYETSTQNKENSNRAFLTDSGEQPIRVRDVSPVHFATQESLDDLNSKLDKKVFASNFRPNLVVQGSSIFAEDEWKYIKFSSGTEIRSFLPCARCFNTTFDRETGKRIGSLPTYEPLKTLGNYRLIKEEALSARTHRAPCFGYQCDVEKTGTISVGDEVFAVVEKDFVEYKK